MQSTEDWKDKLGAILRTLKIRRIEYGLSGGGDSGETTLERVIYVSGAVAHDLPNIPVTVTNAGSVIKLPDLLERIVSDAPEGDWINNEGGQGTVTVRPFEEEDGLFIECDMTFNDEDDGDDDFDDEFDDSPDDWDDDPSPSSPAAFQAGEVLE
ncbi:MAG: hypothetical protein OJJ21_10740 [Ferrovibrio sp.]|uniref:hypothetical protein n=1 Tax=Ferrovibrio sp. TaxID=1917215 RepID=UPI002614326F|nr:hypothetical protein [Ferrovibrio sp.]MCW0234065.1 hypothetical protein [Ferrovibrio sp.]